MYLLKLRFNYNRLFVFVFFINVSEVPQKCLGEKLLKPTRFGLKSSIIDVAKNGAEQFS